MAALYIVVAG